MAANPTIKDELFQAQVIQAAQQLFQQYGMYKVTMDDVAKAVGKGRSSLYYYYKSKEEILYAVLDVEIGEILAGMTQAVNQQTTAEAKIHAFCATQLKGLRKRKALYNTVDMDGNEMAYRAKAALAVRERYRKQQSDLLSQILRYGIDSGEFHPLNQKELDRLIFVLLSGLKGLVREMVLEKDDNLEPAINTWTRLIVHGLKKG